MSYMLCPKCGEANGMVGMTLFQCACARSKEADRPAPSGEAKADARAPQVGEEDVTRRGSSGKRFAHCCGYPQCDGDLVGIEHDSKCPLYGKKESNPDRVRCHAPRQPSATERGGRRWKMRMPRNHC